MNATGPGARDVDRGTRWLPRWVPRLALACACVWLAGCAALYGFQDGLVFVPSKTLVRTPADAGLDYESVELATSDGETLLAWWIPPPDDKSPVVLFAHGNAGNLSHRLETLRVHHGMGHGILAFDYRGYGTSTGSPSEAGVALDARAAYEHLVSARAVAPERIILHGRSLGGAVAIELATARPAAGLIVEAAFTSLPDLGAELYPLFPIRLLARIRFPNLERIATLDLPILVIHGRHDTLVPHRHGEALHAAAPNSTMLTIDGGHNDAFVTSRADYLRGITGFVADAIGSGD